ncbi:MAG: hypothetical protein E5Y88_33080 [Mesorhizobium sp.]|uniref:hypothetical protein n=1 Tax=Mesorhizobium sp. TaxID=1871066 RepID=UPI001216E3C3|nr:hypothetical protein [Mesorhizobium sp.]TIL19858.1 MAG: hypothetical protein E5Y88_33080 [Mesorhizobium sp.]
MNTIGTDQLEPNRFYWARRLPAKGTSISEPSDIEVVQISTVFGAALRVLDGRGGGQRRTFRSLRLRILSEGPLPADRRGSPPEFDHCFRRIAAVRPLNYRLVERLTAFNETFASATNHEP